jgi:hypothetical protein
MDRVPKTSVPEEGAPLFITIELEDSAPPRYQLTMERTLFIGGEEIARYRLIAALLYKSGSHYIVDCYDAREQSWIHRWIRYDGYPPACGEGQRVQGPASRVKHTHGLKGTYFPIMLVYGKVAPNDSSV